MRNLLIILAIITTFATSATIDFPNAKVNTKNVLPKQTYTIGDTITFVYPVGISGFIYFMSTSDTTNRKAITNIMPQGKWIVQDIDTTSKGKFQLISSNGTRYYSDSLIVKAKPSTSILQSSQHITVQGHSVLSNLKGMKIDLNGRVR